MKVSAVDDGGDDDGDDGGDDDGDDGDGIMMTTMIMMMLEL